MEENYVLVEVASNKVPKAVTPALFGLSPSIVSKLKAKFHTR